MRLTAMLRVACFFILAEPCPTPHKKKASPKTSLFYPYKPSQLERIIFTRPTALKELTGDFEHHRA